MDDINLDDYTGECDVCGKKYIPANANDHCPEEGLCWEHCTNEKEHWPKLEDFMPTSTHEEVDAAAWHAAVCENPNNRKGGRNAIDTLSVWAVRYALGRMTYAVFDVVNTLTLHSDDLSTQSRFVICEDIDRAEAEGRLGMEMDAQEWRTLRNVLKSRLPYREIGYTAEECERDMRRMTNGERGCANPEEHEGSKSPHMWKP